MDKVYISACHGDFICLDGQIGRIEWDYYHGVELTFVEWAEADGNLFVCDREQRMFCWEPQVPGDPADCVCNLDPDRPVPPTPTRTPTSTVTKTSTPTVTATPTASATPTPTAVPRNHCRCNTEKPVAYPNPDPGKGPMYFSMDGGVYADVRLSIFTPSGRKLFGRVLNPNGPVEELIWDLKDDRGAELSNGLYYAVIETARSGDVRRHISKVMILH